MTDQAEAASTDSEQPEATRLDRPNDAVLYVLLAVTTFLLLSAAYGLATAGWRWEKASAGLGLGLHDIARRWFLHSTLAEILVIWWVVAVSGTIGSFLNVVVYRMPRGLSLSRSGSRCVHCQASIQWYDNQPVIGWFILQGRCRHCHGPISGRYPLVEFMAVVCGLILFFVTVQTKWVGPPSVGMNHLQSMIGYYFWLLDPTPAQRLLMFFYLLPVLMACLAIAWASFDGNRLPQRFYFWVMSLCTTGSLLYQTGLGRWLAHQFGRLDWQHVQFLSPSVRAWVGQYAGQGAWADVLGGAANGAVLLIGQGLGLIIGATIGWLLTWTIGRLWRESNRVIMGQAPAIFAMLGLVGGWYLPLAVALLWSGESLIRILISKDRHAHFSSIRREAIWFGLPFYLLVAIVVWRWCP
jgi:prepilin signal peptidase PulO-like enzyme (type II secretory pathway)